MRLEIETTLLSLYVNLNNRFEVYLTKREGVVSTANHDYKLWPRW